MLQGNKLTASTCQDKISKSASEDPIWIYMLTPDFEFIIPNPSQIAL